MNYYEIYLLSCDTCKRKFYKFYIGYIYSMDGQYNINNDIKTSYSTYQQPPTRDIYWRSY